MIDVKTQALPTEGQKRSEVLRRYRMQFGIPPAAAITEEMVLRHWHLERSLARELIDSTPQDRWEVFERCYTSFYRELADLNQFWSFDTPTMFKDAYADWTHLIGQPPKKIYEIGSGKGGLIRYLAELGHECRGTEISKERGHKWARPHPRLSWGTSDGVHLERFERANSYDVVISDQVIEHLHPDDLVDHFRGVMTILNRGGRYIFDTPHAFFGPSDISRVFRYETPQGFHLKEYTWTEIVEALNGVGFTHVYAVLSFPRSVRRLFRRRPNSVISRAYLLYVLCLENILDRIPWHGYRRLATLAAAKIARFSGIRGVAEKRFLATSDTTVP